MKMERTECSETLAIKLYPPENNPKKAYDNVLFASWGFGEGALSGAWPVCNFGMAALVSLC
jgi:hypothetical protein